LAGLVDEVDGLRLEKVLKVHQRGGILAGGDRDTSLPPDPRQAGIVFGRPDRLFEPAQIEWTQFARLSRALRTDQGQLTSSMMSMSSLAADAGSNERHMAVHVCVVGRDSVESQTNPGNAQYADGCQN
jgi:hypothetical protein